MSYVFPFVTSYIIYRFYGVCGYITSRRVPISFPDNEDYDANELIDEGTLGIVKRALSDLTRAVRIIDTLSLMSEHLASFGLDGEMLDEYDRANGVLSRVPTL